MLRFGRSKKTTTNANTIDETSSRTSSVTSSLSKRFGSGGSTSKKSSPSKKGSPRRSLRKRLSGRILSSSTNNKNNSITNTTKKQTKYAGKLDEAYNVRTDSEDFEDLENFFEKASQSNVSVFDPDASSISSSEVSALEDAASVNSDTTSFERIFGFDESSSQAGQLSGGGTFDIQKAKELLSDVLNDTSSTNTAKARKLFLIDQLRKPAPPTEPPPQIERSMSGINLAAYLDPNGSSAGTRRTLSRRFFRNHAGEVVTTTLSATSSSSKVKIGNATGEDLYKSLRPTKSNRASQAFVAKAKVGSNRRSLLPTYDPAELAKQDLFRRKFWNLSLVVSKIGWRLRVFIIRDLSNIVSKIHESELVHKDIELNNLVIDEAFRVELKDLGNVTSFAKLKTTISPMADGDYRMRDILMLGLTFLRISSMNSDEHAFPRLRELLERETKSLGKTEFDDSIAVELAQLVEDEVRDTFRHLENPMPGSLEELIVQCCSANRELRPIAVDISDWLSSITDDLKREIAPTDRNSPDNPINSLLAIEQEFKSNVIRMPKIIDLNTSTDGYESDDSYQPPPAVPARTKSLTTSTKFSSFLTEREEDNNSTEFGYVKNDETRRRSLDRGYFWAKKSMLKEPLKPIVNASNVGEFKKAWQVSQTPTKVSDPNEVALKFKEQERLTQEEALSLVKTAEAIMRKEPNMVTIKAPAIVVGDIHGQFFDLLTVLRLGGSPENTTYVFLGDYVDRGPFSCEVILYLYALKAKYPEKIILLRGNHESRTVASYFGFKSECEVKYGLNVFNRIITSFQCLPIACLVESIAGNFLCCHGGISPNVTSLRQFETMDRFNEPGMNGFLCDVLWSDPVQDSHDDGDNQSLSDFLSIDYLPNPARGCSYRYGYKSLLTFLATNRLVCIVRAHEVQMAGYRYHFQELTGGKGKVKANVMPPVITVFSAPNYCGRYGNQGAILKILATPEKQAVKGKTAAVGGAGLKPLDLLQPVQFFEVSHPEPMEFESEQYLNQIHIENTCPYMPTTFYAFVNLAIKLAEARIEEAEERERQRLEEAKRVQEPVNMSLMDRTRSVLRNSLSLKSKSSSPDVFRSSEVGGAPTPRRHQTLAERKATDRFQTAAANDGINEMNPEVVQQKLDEARTRLDETNSSSPVLFEQKSLNKAESAFSLKETRSKRTMSVKLSSHNLKSSHSSESEDEGSSSSGNLKKKTDDAVTFTEKELVALQMLFLIIDRTDRGSITVDDLIAWSAEDGSAVQPDEARQALEIVDEDQDGKIGFEDYLSFAARSKNRFMLQQLADVLNNVRKIREDSDVVV